MTIHHTEESVRERNKFGEDASQSQRGKEWSVADAVHHYPHTTIFIVSRWANSFTSDFYDFA